MSNTGADKLVALAPERGWHVEIVDVPRAAGSDDAPDVIFRFTRGDESWQMVAQRTESGLRHVRGLGDGPMSVPRDLRQIADVLGVDRADVGVRVGASPTRDETEVALRLARTAGVVDRAELARELDTSTDAADAILAALRQFRVLVPNDVGDGRYNLAGTEDAPADATTATRQVWIEKTIVQGRPDREEGEFALGRALWSPQRARRGADVYRFMRDVAPDDVILHLTDNAAFTGVSIAADSYEEFDGVADTEWGIQPSYRVSLKSFRELSPPFARDSFFSPPYREQLLGLIEAGARNLFYNRGTSLNQGAYLTPAPSELVSVLADAYQAVAGIPILELEDMTSTPPPTPEVVPPTAENLSRWLGSRGLIFSPWTVAVYLTALQTKGLVILSGVSGTGKTKLAQAIAELMTADDEGNHAFLAVRPDWRDSKPLLGYYNPLSERFESTPLVRMLLRAGGVESADLGSSVRREIRERSEWSESVERVLELTAGQPPDKLTIDALHNLWHATNNGIASSGQAPRLAVTDDILRQATEILANQASTPGERYIGAMEFFAEVGVERRPWARTMRVLCAFDPSEVSSVADIGVLRDVAKHFGYAGLGIKRLVEDENADGLNDLFATIRDGVAGLLGDGASRGERAIGAWIVGQYLRGELLAAESFDDPYFLILDEMNLARVEYYFADFLSVLESGRTESGLTREPVRLHDRGGGSGEVRDWSGEEIPPALPLPPNLYVVGTINVDETTHTVSPKVLDRAFTIEMSDVRFGAPVGADAPPIDDEQLLKDFTRAGRFAVVDSSIDQVAANHPGSARTQVTDGADEGVSSCRPPYATASSEISECQRARKSRRCSANET